MTKRPLKRPLTLEQAKARYPHRFTMEHVPAWAADKRPDGNYYAPQYETDQEWYERTLFPGEGHVRITEDHCTSNNPTWPMGLWLAQPFKKYPDDKAEIARKEIERRLEAFPHLVQALRSILLAHDTKNNGAAMGEAVLCKHYAEMARAALSKAGVHMEAP